MKRRPTIIKTDLPAPKGVKKTKTSIQHQSQKGKNYIINETITTTITNETPAESVKEVIGQKIGSSCHDLLKDMEKTAKAILEQANLPTEVVITKKTINSKIFSDSKSPMTIAEDEFGKHSDEYNAGTVLFWVTACRRSIEEDKAEAAVYAVIQANNHFHKLIIDERAYAIGLHSTNAPKSQDWITRAKKIMTDRKFTTKELLSPSRSITFGKLAILVADDQAKAGLDPDNEESIRKSLAAYFK